MTDEQMTEDDKHALKEFMRGVVFTVTIVGVAIIGIVMLSRNDVPIPEQSTEVVGKYKECDIIRWNAHQLAEYKYFLYCPKYQDFE